MKSHLVIAIQDSNRFFALGIQLILQGHFLAKGQTVSFVPLVQGENHDLIIQAEWSGWPGQSQCIWGCDGEEQPRILVIREVSRRHRPLHYPCQREQGVINRRERPNAVSQLIEHMFETPLSPAPQCTRCSIALTPREQEVLQAIAAELPSHQIARKLTIHLKTVSAHKTAAMRKLGFRRNSELYHWLRNGGLEFRKRVVMQALKVQIGGLEDKLAELQAQRDKLQTKQNAQLDTIEHNATELATLRTEKQALQTQYAAVQQQVSTADARLSKQDQEILRLQEDVTGLRERAKWLIKPENLKKPERRQAYAAGSALGRDIIEMLQERQSWGVQADRHTVLAGVIDAFSGQYQLTTDVLSQALTESETVVNQAREKASAAQQKKGEDFVASFKKKKGVKQSPSGFWYLVSYVGDSPIAEDAIVEVVVKESLTDGTVIKDMDLDGNVLSQPLTAYPPLFREAMGYLRNHGTLTMVVPPEQAYGEVGYPPKVPPNATMVYEIRIDGIKTPTDL